MDSINKLVKKAQKGNADAFLTLFKEYEERLYRTAFIYVKNQNDALDVVQETAYKAFKNIRSMKQPQYFQTWITKIAMGCAIDLIRKNKKVVPLHSDYHELNGIEDGDIPLSLSLEELMNDLTETEKSIVLLKYYSGYTFKEIAEIETMPLATVKSVLYRSLEKLRKKAHRGELYEQ